MARGKGCALRLCVEVLVSTGSKGCQKRCDLVQRDGRTRVATYGYLKGVFETVPKVVETFLRRLIRSGLQIHKITAKAR